MSNSIKVYDSTLPLCIVIAFLFRYNIQNAGVGREKQNIFR